MRVRQRNQVPHQHDLRFNYIWQLQLCFSQPDRAELLSPSTCSSASCIAWCKEAMGIHANALLTNTEGVARAARMCFDDCVNLENASSCDALSCAFTALLCDISAIYKNFLNNQLRSRFPGLKPSKRGASSVRTLVFSPLLSWVCFLLERLANTRSVRVFGDDLGESWGVRGCQARHRHHRNDGLSF